MTSVDPVDPTFVAPAPGSTLAGEIQVFRWDLGGIPIENSWLYVGSSVGGAQYGSRNTGGRTVTSVGGLPTDQSPVFVRLWYRTGGSWRFHDERYTAASAPALPAITDPEPGSTLDGASQTFRWNFNSIDPESSWLYVGSMIGGSDFAAVQTGTATSVTVDRLPTDGSVVHVRLYFQTGGWWYHIDDQFEASDEPPPDRDTLTRELQGLVGTTPDGIVGPQTMAALNRNWLGRTMSFDPSFAARFTNDAPVVDWVKRRINTRAGLDLPLDGLFDGETEAAVVAHLDRGGVVAAESFVTLLDP